MNVLVTGATGFVGGRLLPALRDAGHTVTAMTRNAAGFDPPTGVRVVEADLLDPSTLTGVFDGIDAVYYLVHSMGSGPDFADRDRRAARNFTAAASAAGVDRVIYLGGLGDENDDLSEHLRSRREVESILAEGAAAVTVLRAGVVIGEGSLSWRIIRQLAGRLPVMVTPQWVRTPCQPIAAADTVGYLLGVLEEPATAGEVYEIGGPEVLSYEEMLRRTRAAMGGRLFVVPVPVLSPKLSVRWVTTVTDVEPSVARPLIEGLRNPVVVRDDSIREHVAPELTGFDEMVRRALGDAEARTAPRGVTG